MDCISKLPSEMTATVPSALLLLDVREGRGISNDISEFFLQIKIS